MTAVYFSREKLNALVPPAGLEGAAELLNGLEYDRSSVCSAVVTALRPLLARLAPEPEAGWLPALYAWLDNGLFPDPAYQAPPEAPVLAALAELLDGVLACEDAPFDIWLRTARRTEAVSPMSCPPSTPHCTPRIL